MKPAPLLDDNNQLLNATCMDFSYIYLRITLKVYKLLNGEKPLACNKCGKSKFLDILI